MNEVGGWIKTLMASSGTVTNYILLCLNYKSFINGKY